MFLSKIFYPALHPVLFFESAYDAYETASRELSRFFEDKRERKAWRQGYFYVKFRNVRVKLEPLETYFALQDRGFDRVDEVIKRITRKSDDALLKTGENGENAIQEFHRVMRDVFGVVSYVIDRKRGLNMYEMTILYARFFSFLVELKKKHTALQGFAPSLEARWKALKEPTVSTAGYRERGLSSESTKTSPEPREPQDSQATMERQEPSTD